MTHILPEKKETIDTANTLGKEAEAITGVPFQGLDTSEPVTTPTPVQQPERFARTITPEPTPPPIESTEDIQARKRKEAQGEIDSLTKFFDTQVAEQRKVNVGEERRTSAVSSLTGLAGSTEASVEARKTEARGATEIKAVRAEQEARIQQVLSGVRTSAVEESRFLREEARLDADTAQEQRTLRQQDAIAKLSILGADGDATIEGLKASMSEEDYDYLVRNVGGEAIANAILVESRPKSKVSSTKIVGDSYVQITDMPDGTQKIEAIPLSSLGIDTTGVKSVQKLDNGQIMIVNDDGTWKTVGDVAVQGGGGGEVGTEEQQIVESIMSGIGSTKDVSTKDGKRQRVINQLAVKFNEAKSAGDIEGIMSASAAFDKVPSDTFLQSFGKVVNVLGQLGVLQENLTKGFDEGKVQGIKTGPIVGAFKSLNPWSTEGQVIKAQLNAIVPNLARGVYGEVGVLTDNDIKTYSKTIPNLSSPEDIRNAVLYITIDMIRRDLEGKINTQTAGQRDMSGFADVYKNLNQQANDILASIGDGQQVSDPADTLTSPNGKQQVSMSELTPEELQEAESAGWK